MKIEEWFRVEVERVKHQSEKVRIYHHELHKQHIKKSAILKLQTELGMLEGHTAYSEYLQKAVANLLLHPALLDPAAQQILLAEIEPQFTDKDNKMMTSAPTKEEVEESVRSSNVNASPGCDGITSLVYRECFEILGDALTEVAKEIFGGQQPTQSQRTSLMLFYSKPGKSQSIRTQDKRRLALLNSDFKVITGLELGR